MNEAYLQEIWSLKRIPITNLQTVDNNSITILEFGEHNTNKSGPDFYLGGVEFNGIKIYGDIEIHVNASDWYKHNHHLDSRYNAVVLHVVYNYDKPVIQNGLELPTIEIRSLIDPDHYQKYILRRLKRSLIPCKDELNTIDPIYLESMKSKALTHKLNEKIKTFRELNNEINESFYQLLAQAFGTAINKNGFETLTSRVPYKSIESLNPKQRFKLLISESGVVNNSTSSNQWHYKGTRPGNFPSRRVRQFAHFMSYLNMDRLISFVEYPKIIRTFNQEMDRIFSNGSLNFRPTKMFRNHLIINAIVPYIWFLAERKNNILLLENVEDVLKALKPESNNIIEKWESIGIEVANAYDSQSLLALYRYFCKPKKCLSCEVGNKVLDRIK